MNPRRVAITGIGFESPLGRDIDTFTRRLFQGESAVRDYGDQLAPTGLATRLASIVPDFDERAIPRQSRRSMSRVSMMAVSATRRAIDDAGLGTDLIQHERTGVSFGSTMGGTSATEKCFRQFIETGSLTEGMLSTTFLQIMSHTCAANIVTAFGIPGRVTSTCVACASSTQGIGLGYEAIKYGMADRMICGGAEEFHPAMVAVFDVMRATSTNFNDRPSLTPRPFDAHRDGIVVGEGAGTFVLEDWETARRRGARVYAEVVGFHTNADGGHMTNPSHQGMAAVMRGALRDAGLSASDVSYVNAHATATAVGDVAESLAIADVFGSKTPVSSTKGHLGHLMGAAGVLESLACVGFLREDRVAPTLNLETPDPACAPIDHVTREPRAVSLRYILKNSFAFGGINASIIIGKA